MDVGKREDQLLDKISDLKRKRDAALEWISTYKETGVIEKEPGEWLEMILRGE